MADNNEQQAEYRVLARKYRPQNFEELIGQEALVRTLRNAIETGRIAHAFMLTGVRGVGKTTTARIIAKALNYKGPDGTASATTEDTSDCQLCQAISEDRHPDVIEMDAASRTGVDDIREILDGVRYAPTEARYKVYIIDEVHMLSKQAFNALLKTLEEPPAHVKFIFATTEIRKVPITVLSRCQRFDLRRVDVPTLADHFANICNQENVKAEKTSLELIARAADGSVRDGLSILDQAISVSQGDITTNHIQDMLGLADKAAMLDMIEYALKGDTQNSLDILDSYYKAGADPVIILQDLLEISHLLTRLKAVPEMKDAQNHAMSPDMLARAAEIGKTISMPSLGKTWQLLLKGLQEVQHAPNPQIAAEMAIIRLSYAANLPDPKDLVEALKKKPSSLATSTPTIAATTLPKVSSSAPTGNPAPSPASSGSLKTIPQTQVQTGPINSLQEIVNILECGQEIVLASAVSCYAEPIKVEEGLLEIGLRDNAGSRIKDLSKSLRAITGKNWMVSFVNAKGIPTLDEAAKKREQDKYNAVLAHPNVQTIINTFEGSKMTEIIKNNNDNQDNK